MNILTSQDRPPGLWAAHDAHGTLGGRGGTPAGLAVAAAAQAGTRRPASAQAPVTAGRQASVQAGRGWRWGAGEACPDAPTRSPRPGRVCQSPPAGRAVLWEMAIAAACWRVSRSGSVPAGPWRRMALPGIPPSWHHPSSGWATWQRRRHGGEGRRLPPCTALVWTDASCPLARSCGAATSTRTGGGHG
jgi:hypothetical protein